MVRLTLYEGCMLILIISLLHSRVKNQWRGGSPRCKQAALILIDVHVNVTINVGVELVAKSEFVHWLRGEEICHGVLQRALINQAFLGHRIWKLSGMLEVIFLIAVSQIFIILKWLIWIWVPVCRKWTWPIWVDHLHQSWRRLIEEVIFLIHLLRRLKQWLLVTSNRTILALWYFYLTWLLALSILISIALFLGWASLTISASLTLTSRWAGDTKWKALTISLHATRLFTSATFPMFKLLNCINTVVTDIEESWLNWIRQGQLVLTSVTRHEISSIIHIAMDYLALKSLWISFQYIKFWLLYQISVLFKIPATSTAAFWSTMNSFGKALAVQFQAFRLGARALWTWPRHCLC